MSYPAVGSQAHGVPLGRFLSRRRLVVVVSDSGVAAWFLEGEVFVLDRDGTRRVGLTPHATFKSAITFVCDTVRWNAGGQIGSAPVRP
jgi:hypothetical protein